MTYPDALEWLYSTQTFGIKLGLDNPRKLLRHFLATPSPDTKVVHIAGTNGKGSTSAMVDSLARAAGIRCGLFTSPHLIEFRERIRVNGAMISEVEVLQCTEQLKNLVADWDHHPTFFELTLAIAMRHFKAMGCEIIVLETGMGGRLDATTAVPADVCVLTPIADDHSEWLGDTIEKIAYEKAGIICEGKPVISATQCTDAAAVIAEVADEHRAKLITITEPLRGYQIDLEGDHQAENAQLAIEALNQLEVPLSFDVVQQGLGEIDWPGRFEAINHNPVTIVDGAHNPHAAIALADTWRTRFGKEGPKLVFGAVQEKDVAEVLGILASISSEVHLVPIDSPRSMTTESLTLLLPEDSPPYLAHGDLQNCLMALGDSSEPILVTGSLFLVGEAKSIVQGGLFQRSSQ